MNLQILVLFLFDYNPLLSFYSQTVTFFKEDTVWAECAFQPPVCSLANPRWAVWLERRLRT